VQQSDNEVYWNGIQNTLNVSSMAYADLHVFVKEFKTFI